MSAFTDDPLREFDLEQALELYYQGQIDLEGLCRLMAAYGARRAHDDASGVEEIAQSLSLLVHERATVAALQGAGASDASETQQVGPAGQGAKRSPVETGQGIQPPQTRGPDAGTVVLSEAELAAESKTPPRGTRGPLKTPLMNFCQSRGILPRVSPGLDADSPPIQGPGDQGYSVGPQLGVGGVGQVRLGVDRDLRRTVAIKTLRDQHLDDRVQLQAFIEEAIITGGLEHPNIVAVYDLGYSKELGPHYAMTRIKGKPLSRILRALRARDREVVEAYGLFKLLEIFVEVCQGIAFAHDRGVIHCDLKPSNVVVGDYGEVTIVDWGLARVLGAAGRGQARALLNSGTPAYMPPEQASGRVTDLDAQTDIWSLGAMLYELLTLTVPFRAETSEETIVKLMADTVEPPSERAPKRHIPPVLQRICMRALEKDKLMRYPSVREMLGEVREYVDGVQEKRRRDEEARLALEHARNQLSEVASAEARVDELQARIPNANPRDAATLKHELDGARDDLVFGYTDAAGAVERGLEAVEGHARLSETLGDLYWRIFTRLYPARVSPPEHVRELGMQLLTRLSQFGLTAIVAEAKKRGSAAPSSSLASNSRGKDPWLDAVLGFCGQDLDIEEGSTPNAMAPLIERIAFLKNVPLFERMSAADLLPIAEACDEIELPDGAAVFAEGDYGDALYVVMEGNVAIEKTGNLINRLAPTACFGEIAVLDQAPRTASAVAAGHLRCLVLTAERFRRIVRENGDIGLAVMRVLTARLRVATNREAVLRSGILPTTS